MLYHWQCHSQTWSNVDGIFFDVPHKVKGKKSSFCEKMVKVRGKVGRLIVNKTKIIRIIT